jgi:hypothetical protein
MAKRQRELDRQTLAGKSKATSSWDTPGPSSPKRHNTGSRSPRSPTTHDMSDLVPNLDRDPVRYEEQWANGGRKRFYGPHMVRGSGRSSGPAGHEIWYFCEARNDWYPVPQGFVAVRSINDSAGDDPFAVSNADF